VAGYEILGELGRGGMGVVYQAQQLRLNRPCALKMILAGAHANPEVGARFLAEAQAIARLEHPHVVQIHYIGEADGLPFLELEYVSGGSLDRQLDGVPWTSKRAARLVEQLARGIAEAHRMGIVHRDLKPGNVLLAGDGTPKIADFGLAKALGSEPGLTRTESILGSPSYMAPEQAEGRASQAGPATDIYAVGAILYELLTGRPPFRAATALETLEQVKAADPVPPSRLVPGLPRDLDTICLKCLSKEPGQRYLAVTELAEDLCRFQSGEPIRARRIGGAERALRWCRRNPIVAVLVGGIALALVLGTAVSTAFAIRADLEARRARAEKVQSDRRLYLAVMHLAEQAWHGGQVDRVLQQLPRAIESRRPEDPDPRDFAWYYLLRQCESDRHLRGHAGMVRAVAFSNGGRVLTSAGNDGTIRIWDTVTYRELNTIRGHVGSILGVAYSPDGRTLTSAGSDNTMTLWEAATGRVLHTLHWGQHDEQVWGVAFSPDGRLIASAGTGQTIRLWDAATGQELLSLQGHAGTVRCVTFSPDGSTLASGGEDSTVKLWPAAAATPEELTRREAERVLEFLFARSLTLHQVRERIRHDPTLDDEVRRRALGLAEPYGQSLLAQQAERAVLARYGAGMFRPEVLTSLRGDSALGEPVRRRALELAGRIPEFPYSLNAASWSVVSRPDAEAAAYRRALQQAEHACRLVPQDNALLTTLGAAQYRVGNDIEAVATLTLADHLMARIDGSLMVGRLAFLALAQHRLGKVAEARVALDRLRMVVTQPQWNVSESGLAVLAEINALERDLAFPADPFGP
jgi:hypothetical protein